MSWVQIDSKGPRHSEGLGQRLGTCEYCSSDLAPQPLKNTGKEKIEVKPLSACSIRKANRTRLSLSEFNVSRRLFFSFPKCEIIIPGAVKVPKTDPERYQKAKVNNGKLRQILRCYPIQLAFYRLCLLLYF